MTGLKIVLPTTFTDNTLSILHDDSLLTSGSLLLIDPIHTANPWSAGVPASSSSIPNIAWKEAAATIGSGTQTSLAATFTSAGLSSSVAVLERSGKGGLHGIISQTNNSSANQGAVLSMSSAIQSYLFANQNHSLYFSLWRRITRVGLAASGSPAVSPIVSGIFNSATSQTANQFFTAQTALTNPSVNLGHTPAPGLSNNEVAGNMYRDLAVASYTGTAPGSASQLACNAASWGTIADGVNSLYTSIHNICGSYILYRAYLEDLTVSGRSYSTVSSLDQARFASDVTTSGGRYNGDTFTAPSTVP